MSITSPEFWIALLQIIGVNIVLSGDNAIVIALAARGLPAKQQARAVAWGSGAAVAAGLAPMALGSDGMGSIRIPSTWCGLFGIKPQRDRVPLAPHDDALSGRYLHAEHDPPEQLEARIERILADDLNAIRLRREQT